MSDPYENSEHANVWLDHRSAALELGSEELLDHAIHGGIDFRIRNGVMLYNKASLLAGLTARGIERSVPDEGQVFRFLGEVVQRSEPDRVLTVVGATSGLTRGNSVVDIEGMDISAYEKNPVVLWDRGKDVHRGSIPIGRSLRVWKDKDGNTSRLLARIQFAGDEFSRTAYEQYAEGVLKTWDADILPNPKMFSPPTRSERDLRPELANCTMLCRQSELAAISALSLPGNAGCETVSVGRSLGFGQDSDQHAIAALKRSSAAMRDAALKSVKEAEDSKQLEVMASQFLKYGR